jgi:hypothetical protein
MRHLLAVLCLLPLPALAQTAPDPLRIDPLTGKERSFFDPIGAEELTVRMGTCIRRALESAGMTDAVAGACEAEALDFCARVKALYPFSKPSGCALSVQLAWGDLRHEAGLALVDALYAQANSGNEAARGAAEAFTEEDDVWRRKVANSCLGDMEESERVACETALQRERGVLYYARLTELTGRP